MRFYKLRVTPNAAAIASTFNEQFKPEIITTDPREIHWWDASNQEEVAVGEEVRIQPLVDSLTKSDFPGRLSV